MSYAMPAHPHEAEIEIKKSRFLAFAHPIDSREQAMAIVADYKAAYPDARHHCWAYQLGDPACAYNAGMDDDGEPSGTAGKPILNVLSHKDVGDVLVVVVRYFGGVKLGAGGLTRAYAQSAQAVMETLPVIEKVAMVEVQVTGDFACEQWLRHQAAQFDAEVAAVDYGQTVCVTLHWPQASWPEFEAMLEGQASIEHWKRMDEPST
ncbi:YigZ family protein [Hydrogenovibrio halophilus]|uniref:YigZ family protein n=1 Tax=Hydrogenovibrio halophilus TaxID=373391 RepID=UPI00039B3144|nr:YigZ family protein [Hydrogenovibrio halophilus]